MIIVVHLQHSIKDCPLMCFPRYICSGRPFSVVIESFLKETSRGGLIGTLWQGFSLQVRLTSRFFRSADA